MPKKSKKDEAERINMRAPADWVERVETWRSKQRPIPNFSEAVRTLADIGIEKEIKRREKKR